MTWKTYKPPGGYVHKPPSGTPARGEGWGGDARGAGGKPFSADHQPPAEAKAAGREAAQTAREVAKSHAVAMAQLLAEIALDPTAPHGTRVDAANKLIERAEGKAAMAVGGDPNGVPIKTVVAWEDGK
jgi:hypothetical protein